MGDKKQDVIIQEKPPEDISEEQAEIDLTELYSPNNVWTPEQKISAVQAYMITGSSIKAEKICGIKASTIRWWKNQSSWWNAVMSQVRRDKQDELDGQFTTLLDKVMNNLEDRLEHGDEVLDKEGNIRHKKIDGRSLATIGGIIYDKRHLLRSDPDSKGQKSETSAVEALAERFANFTQQMKDSGLMGKPIEGEVIRNEDNES
jgi:hypothetical protein